MLGFDSEIGISALRLWVAAGSAALLLVSCAVALLRPQSGIGASPVFRAGLVVLGAVLGAAMMWAFLDRAAVADRSAEHRALEQRAQELSARALAPGSSLACLDAVAGENVAAACERALFVSPASVAAASFYVAARLALLSDTVAYAGGRGGAGIDDVLLPLRGSLEADPFGFLAHVLSIRDGCTNHNCKALALLHDASRVRANLSAETFDHYLEHYLALWAKAPDGPLADAAPAQTAAIPQGPRKVSINADFPSAASIPAVSIMNPEPTGPVLPGVAAAAAANPNPAPAAAPSSSRRARKQAATPAPQAELPPSAAIEPVWPEPVPPPPQAAAAPAASAPMQLNPVPPPSAASAGMNGRSQ